MGHDEGIAFGCITTVHEQDGQEGRHRIWNSASQAIRPFRTSAWAFTMDPLFEVPRSRLTARIWCRVDSPTAPIRPQGPIASSLHILGLGTRCQTSHKKLAFTSSLRPSS